MGIKAQSGGTEARRIMWLDTPILPLRDQHDWGPLASACT